MYRNSKEDRAVRSVASLLITGSRFSQILDLFRGLKIGVPTGSLGVISIFVVKVRIYIESIVDFINSVS